MTYYNIYEETVVFCKL